MKTDTMDSGGASTAAIAEAAVSPRAIGRDAWDAAPATGSVRTLVIGVGSIGERHLRCFGATGRVAAAIVEPNLALRETIASRYDVPRAFADLDAAIAARPDVAIIATPAPLHVSMATRLAEAGVHVLIEKPLSTNLDGLDALAAAVRRNNVVAAVAYVYRAHPALASMRAAIASGRFGAPRHLYATCGQNFPFYRPAYRQTYYAKHESGGGAIQDALTHVVNAGEWLVGPVTRLFADAGHQVLEGVDVEDTAHIVARQGADVMASYAMNQHQAPFEVTITVACDRGTARFEFHRNAWSWMTKPGDAWVEGDAVVLERDTLFTLQAKAFLDAAAGRAAPLCTLDEGISTLRANLAALASAAAPCWTPLP